MKVAILSSFYPLRGGISQFNASMLAGLGKLHDVRAFSFKRQYPELLFPGKTQYVTPDDEAVPVEAEVNSMARGDLLGLEGRAKMRSGTPGTTPAAASMATLRDAEADSFFAWKRSRENAGYWSWNQRTHWICRPLSR